MCLHLLYLFCVARFLFFFFFFFKQKTAYEMRISDWSSDVCSSDLSSLASAVVGISGTTSVEKFYITIAAAIRFPAKIRIIQCLHICPMRWHVYCCLLLVWSARFVRGGSGKPDHFFYLTLISTLRGKPARRSSSPRPLTVTRHAAR